MENAFVRTPADVLAHFGVAEQAGLSESQVQQSRQKYGPNGNLAPIVINYLDQPG